MRKFYFYLVGLGEAAMDYFASAYFINIIMRCFPEGNKANMRRIPLNVNNIAWWKTEKTVHAAQTRTIYGFDWRKLLLHSTFVLRFHAMLMTFRLTLQSDLGKASLRATYRRQIHTIEILWLLLVVLPEVWKPAANPI